MCVVHGLSLLVSLAISLSTHTWMHARTHTHAHTLTHTHPHTHTCTSSDLYWEQHFTTIPLETPCLEEADQYLPPYQLPEQVEKLLELGKYENVENRVTKDNYKRRMHNLLYLEEYERRKCMSRYKVQSRKYKFALPVNPDTKSVSLCFTDFHV